MLAVYLTSFIIYYLSSYILYENDFLAYLRIFSNKLTYLLVPLASAVIALIIYAFSDMRHTLICLIPLTFARIIYYIPYFYLIFIFDNFDSVEALPLAFLVSLLEAGFAYAINLGFFLMAKWIIEKKKTKEDSFADTVAIPTALDFNNPTSFAFMIFSLIAFLYFFIYEIINTVSFIMEYSGSFTSTEIIYTVFSYIFDISLLLIYYFAISFIKNTIIKKRLLQS